MYDIMLSISTIPEKSNLFMSCIYCTVFSGLLRLIHTQDDNRHTTVSAHFIEIQYGMQMADCISKWCLKRTN